MKEETYRSNNIIYFQADCRYNQWLLKNYNEYEHAIEATISRMKKIDCEMVITSVYDCQENKELIDILLKYGIQIQESKEELANNRFIETCIQQDGKYIVRVCADQVLLDYEAINDVLKKMTLEDAEWFKDDNASSVMADIVSIEFLRENKDVLWNCNRYFQKLGSEIDVRRYYRPHIGSLLYDFRINSNEHFRICSIVEERKLNVYSLSQKLATKLISRNNYLNTSGIWGSWILGDSTCDLFYDESKNINPWWSYSIIKIIEERVRPEMRVFEYGAGNSTLFWGRYVKDVVAIEYDYDWYRNMKQIIPENVELKYLELEYGGAYCEAILGEKEEFDIVVIDGRDRVRCAKNAVNKIKEEGVIIWDDTDRDSYREGYEYLKSKGYKMLELLGGTYGLVAHEQSTSIFYKEKNIFGL